MHSIWIADDDEAIRLVLEESLSSAGFETKSFSSGEALVSDLENSQPDLIITDVQMPGMLGYDLLKHINNNFEDLPVIVMTAFADMQAAVESFGGGAFEYIPKPFDLEDAIKIIERALEEKPKTKGLKQDTKLDIIGESQAMQNVFRAIGKLSFCIDFLFGVIRWGASPPGAPATGCPAPAAIRLAFSSKNAVVIMTGMPAGTPAAASKA